MEKQREKEGWSAEKEEGRETDTEQEQTGRRSRHCAKADRAQAGENRGNKQDMPKRGATMEEEIGEV